jgi:hypothetical protein
MDCREEFVRHRLAILAATPSSRARELTHPLARPSLHYARLQLAQGEQTLRETVYCPFTSLALEGIGSGDLRGD